MNYHHAKTLDLGYILAPPRRPSEPGHSQLDIFINEEPTYRHFDPESACLMVANSDGSIEHLEVNHPWVGPTDWRVCAGQIELYDYKNKQTRFYTFGGEIHMVSEGKVTTLSLYSSAPIIFEVSIYSTETLLIQQVEIQLAQLRAEWCRSGDDDELENCLACLDPLDLYRMCLWSIRERFGKIHIRSLMTFRFKKLLDREIAAVGQPIMRLDDLHD